MVHQDTVELLRECDAGIQMGVSSIADVLPHVQNDALRVLLEKCQAEHEKLAREISKALDRFQDSGKAPSMMARGMSAMKTGLKMVASPSDATIADLTTDGCNMGVKLLSRYLNQYEAADEHAKDIAKRLIHLEAQLAADIRGYL